jgi:hypothetical protein
MAAKNPYRHDGKNFDLTVEDMVRITGHSRRWVYDHWDDRLGGVKKAWTPDETGERTTIRFPSVGLRKRLKEMGKEPKSEISHAA